MASWVAGCRNKNRFTYKPINKTSAYTRVAVFSIFFVTLLFSSGFYVIILEPYSAFGRMISSLLSPVYLMSNNVLAYFAERMGSYAFYTVDIWLRSLSALVVASITFLVISIFAWKTGRGYCNVICPVGTILAMFAKFSFVKIRLDKTNCNECNLCVKNCKTASIDLQQEKIDHTRCISCFKCINKCPKGSLTYTMKKNTKTTMTQEGKVRRGFLSGLLILVIGLFIGKKAFAYGFDGGLLPLERKRKPLRATPIIPAGADNIRQFRRKCTSCQLCISVCQNDVLRPSSKFSSFLQPHMSFERGYCRPECVKCSEVCPNGAIQPITPEEKSATQIGYAVWNPELCVVLRDNVTCDLCSVRCPTAAITLIDQDPDNPRLPKIPMIDNNRCIGCGACELFCPSRPYSAIYVEGLDTHRRV
jgi:ferredoxin